MAERKVSVESAGRQRMHSVSEEPVTSVLLQLVCDLQVAKGKGALQTSSYRGDNTLNYQVPTLLT